jgi:hypothetical protein
MKIPTGTLRKILPIEMSREKVKGEHWAQVVSFHCVSVGPMNRPICEGLVIRIFIPLCILASLPKDRTTHVTY